VGNKNALHVYSVVFTPLISSLYYIPLYLTDMEQVSNLMQHIKRLTVIH